MPDPDRTERYPGYDVLAKRRGPSWNEQTRRVIDARLAMPREPRFFTEHEFATVSAIAARIVPQRNDRAPIPVAALIDAKLHADRSDGYRDAGMPRQREAWRQGLRAIDAEARQAFGGGFREIPAVDQDVLLTRMQQGELHDPVWGSIPPKTFFNRRMAHDIVDAYFAFPTAWNDIGWGGPAAPRGYVRLGFDERDPWEAAEVKHGDVAPARGKNQRVG